MAYELERVEVRLVKEPGFYSSKPIRTPDDAIEVLAEEFKTYDREFMGVLNIAANGVPINFHVCHIGGLSESIVEPRQIMKAALLSNASGIIMVHNHPSGSLNPSSVDIETTKRIKECGDLLCISLLDHIIIAGYSGEYVSLKNENVF